MCKVKLVVRCLEDGEIVAGYLKQMELPFVPQVGMRFDRGGSTHLWETVDDEDLAPKIEDLVYDIDEEEIVCLFTVNKKLAASFWTEIRLEKVGAQQTDLWYFRNYA